MAKITFRQFNLASIRAVPLWISAKARYLKQRFSKSTKNVHLLEPDFPDPSAKDRSTASPNDAVGAVPNSSSSTQSSLWSLKILLQLEEKEFEELVAAYFREETFRTEISPVGNYEGIDIRLYQKGKQELYAVVQCAVSRTQQVGVRRIRELLGTLIHENVPRGIFVTTGDFTQEAVDFAAQHPIILMTGELLIKDILSYSDDGKTRLLSIAAADRLNPKPVIPVITAVEAFDVVNVDQVAAPEQVSKVLDVAQAAVPDVLEEVASNGFDFPTAHLDVKTVATDLAQKDEASLLNFPIRESRENNLASDATKDTGTDEIKAVADVQSDEVSNSIDFDLFAPITPDAEKEKEQDEKKTSQDDHSEKDSSTIDFPALELPVTEPKAKPPEFFGVFK